MSRKHWLPVMVTTALFASIAYAGPAAAGGATVDRVENFETVLVVAFPENFPIGSISRADCAFIQRITSPDGSAQETMKCRLNDNPVMVPEFQGHPPETTFHNSGGPCEWISDYTFAVHGTDEYASSYSYVVTPSGNVFVHALYPAEPLACE